MADHPKPSRKTQRRKPSGFNQLFAAERNQMELQMRRNALLQYVGEQLTELTALLRSAGLEPTSVTLSPMPQQANVPTQFAPPLPVQVARPCTWCGKAGEPVNVGGGVVQDLCRLHKQWILGQQKGPDNSYAGAAAVGMSVDRVDMPAMGRPHMNSGKVVMHPTAVDMQQSVQHAQQVNGIPVETEELSDDGK